LRIKNEKIKFRIKKTDMIKIEVEVEKPPDLNPKNFALCFEIVNFLA